MRRTQSAFTLTIDLLIKPIIKSDMAETVRGVLDHASRN